MESWVLVWVSDADGLIAEVFAAEILGLEAGRPGKLLLGAALFLGSGGPGSGGFTPADEDLELGDDDDGDAATDLGA